MSNSINLQPFENYLMVDPSVLLTISSTIEFNIFLKISSNKFLKVVSKDSKKKTEEITHFIKKGSDKLFIKKEDTDLFQQTVVNFSVSFEKDFPKEKKLENFNQYIFKVIESIGINNETLAMTNELAKKIQNTYKGDTKGELFIRMATQNVDLPFAYAHSFMMATICSSIGTQLGWEKEKNILKIVTACLLHDAGFKKDEYIKLHDLYPDQMSDLDPKIKENIENQHTYLIEKLYDNSEIDKGVLNIIQKSHGAIELMKGTYKPLFGVKLNSAIKVFLIAHDFVNEFYLASQNTYEIPDIIVKVFIRFNNPHFEKEMKAFKSVFFNIAKDKIKASRIDQDSTDQKLVS